MMSVSSFTLSEAVTLSPSTATIISTIIPSPTVLLQNIARIVFRLAASELGLIATVGSNERAQLEDSIVAVYRQGLSTLGGRRRRQLSSSPRAYVSHSVEHLVIFCNIYIFYRLLMLVV